MRQPVLTRFLPRLIERERVAATIVPMAHTAFPHPALLRDRYNPRAVASHELPPPQRLYHMPLQELG